MCALWDPPGFFNYCTSFMSDHKTHTHILPSVIFLDLLFVSVKEVKFFKGLRFSRVAVFRLFGLRNPFTLVIIIEDPEELLFMWIIFSNSYIRN